MALFGGQGFSPLLLVVPVLLLQLICLTILPQTPVLTSAFVQPQKVSLSSWQSLQVPSSRRIVLQSNTQNDGSPEVKEDVGQPLISDKSNFLLGSNRRTFFRQALQTPVAAMLGLSSVAGIQPPQPALARGLMQFPCTQPLVNRYHFMRAGTSLVEEEDGIWSTNPLFITNREYALSEEGRRVVEKQAEVLKKAANPPTLAYHSLAANGIDSADIIGQELRLGRERILPEFTYLDQRGIGGWNDGSMEDVQPAIWALDKFEASKEGVGGRPPPNEDGTPNETLADQFVRLRQFLSLLESRTSGENVLLIFPDGTGPALLSCMIAGIPLYDVHSLEYAPGELRMDITRESILELYEQKKNDPDYQAALEVGKEKLTSLRKSQGKDVLSLKDQRAEQERMDMEKAFKEKEQQRLSREAVENKLAREKRLKIQEERRNNNKKYETQTGGDATDNSQVSNGADASLEVSPTVLAAAGGLGIAGLAIAVGTGPSSSDEVSKTAEKEPNPVTGGGSTESTADTDLSSLLESNGVNVTAADVDSVSSFKTKKTPNPAAEETVSPESVRALNISNTNSDSNNSHENHAIEKELEGLEVASKAMDTFLEQEDMAKSIRTNNDDYGNVDDELEKLEAAKNAMDEYLDMDDGYYDWLQVFADIRDEPDFDNAEQFVGLQEDVGLLQRNTTTARL